eukprot:3747640-Pyramimonas_sp.AAC.1
MPRLPVFNDAGAVVSRFVRQALPSVMQSGVGVHEGHMAFARGKYFSVDFIMHPGIHGEGPAGLLLDANDIPIGPSGSGPLYLSRRVAEGLAATGTTGAMLLAFRDIGWLSISAFVVVADFGDKIDFRSFAPYGVRELARAAAVRKMWSSWASCDNPADDGVDPKEPIW